ncbi:insulin-like 5a [Pimephales promelas]|uniref:insulin-like 5a n=1 Tax=Pimephales promelas TaxID=90988 RepID=UPI001955A4F2|nr:insulin-like 5a [Pimephales promelas]KAG1941018.1 relaxin-3 [Pimephales promelas]
MRMLYSPAVLLLCAVCSVSVIQADVRTVKLCGREFIRAVVYTCGGSRWRRFSPKDMEGFFNRDLSSSEDVSESLGSDLIRRELDVDNVCCQFGCKKSDLTFLC